MHLSKRFADIPPSPTVSLNTKAKELGQQGIHVINLSVGEPDYPTPAPIVEAAIAGLKKGKTRYSTPGGSLALRQAIAKKLLRENNLHYAADEIVCGIGAKEILFHLALSICTTDDEVIIPTPYWVSYASHFEMAGARCRFVPMRSEAAKDANGRPTERLSIDVHDVKKAASPRTRAIMLNFPCNPTGSMLSQAQYETLGQFLGETDWWIISDEIYEYMTFGKKHINLLDVCPQLKDRFVHVNGLSKSFAMTGWRVGYAASVKPLIKVITNLQSQSSTCLPPFIEDAALAALESGPSIMQADIAALIKKKDLALSLLAEEPRLSYVQPDGAFYLFIDARNVCTANRSTSALASHLLEKHHVAVVPGEAFGAPGYLRMSFATSETDLKEGMTRILKGCSDF